MTEAKNVVYAEIDRISTELRKLSLDVSSIPQNASLNNIIYAWTDEH